MATAGLMLMGFALAGILSTWGFDWVTIESTEPAIESTAEPTTTQAPLPEPTAESTEEITSTTDAQYPPDSIWRVFNVPAALNVRAGPGTNHQILGTAELDSTVTLTGQVAESETSGTWVQAQTTTVTGWVFASYLTPVPPSPQ
ncbi:MAG: SH3 domain-containing protein [Acidimicrobiia bacterium]|nr:SH3 domain-containing protein [Acidimicrobiia bacterium]MYC57916.1 SH3 domain-containing protein [Acidimicrobiia bacterium]MYI29839.1 SH3 domain-containing protein [Acidimicrobiia bacterium]